MKFKQKPVYPVYDAIDAEGVLNFLARAALNISKVNNEKAVDVLDDFIRTENSAVLERELCSAYRRLAMRALLAAQWHELPAARRALAEVTGNVIALGEAPKAGGRGYKTPSEYNADAQRAVQRRWLDEYKLNGQPIGACTVREAAAWAAARERDARFVLRLIEGLPDEAVIGDVRTHEDAEICWNLANHEVA